MANNDAPTEIWRVPSAGGPAERVVGTQGVARDPELTPDGSGLIYAGDQSRGALNLWWRSASGRARAAPHPRSRGLPRAPDLRDGRRLVCEARTSVGLAPRPGRARALAGARPRADGGGGRGRLARPPPGTGRIAFSSARSGTYDVWTSDGDGANARPLTSDAENDSLPAISPDGSRVAFVSEPWWPPRACGSCPTAGGAPRLAGARGRRGPAVLVARRSEPRLRGRGNGLEQLGLWIVSADGGAPVAVPGVRGRNPAWSPASDLIAYFHVVGVGRARGSVHDQPGRAASGPTRREDHPGRRAGLLLDRESARDRRFSGIRGSAEVVVVDLERGQSAAWSGCRPSRGSAGLPGLPTTRGSSTASSSTRAGSSCSRASSAARASGSSRRARGRRRMRARSRRRRGA